MNKVAIVTGTSRGLGRNIAVCLMDMGYAVHGCSRGQAEINHPHYTHRQLDLCEIEKLVQWIGEIEAAAGHIDVVVNNAAINHLNVAMLTPVSVIDYIYRVNVVAPMVLSREALRSMVANRRGNIINLSSIATVLHAEGTATYTASKAALEAYTKVLAKEVGHYGIRCNCMALSYFPTEMAEKTPESAKNELRKYATVRRDLRAYDIEHAVRFLLDESSSALNGHVLRLGF